MKDFGTRWPLRIFGIIAPVAMFSTSRNWMMPLNGSECIGV